MEARTMRRRRTSPEARLEVLELRRTHSFRYIADRTGLDLNTVKSICGRSGLFSDNPEHAEWVAIPLGDPPPPHTVCDVLRELRVWSDAGGGPDGRVEQLEGLLSEIRPRGKDEALAVLAYLDRMHANDWEDIRPVVLNMAGVMA